MISFEIYEFVIQYPYQVQLPIFYFSFDLLLFSWPALTSPFYFFQVNSLNFIAIYQLHQSILYSSPPIAHLVPFDLSQFIGELTGFLPVMRDQSLFF
jgi:hypothetical protein